MSGYSGTDNLEVMADAVNYNDYLFSLVLNNALASDDVLDFGAGIGTFASKVSRRVSRVYCVEPDMKQAAVISDMGLNVFASIEEIPPESVDLVYSFNVLEHIEDDLSSLRECFRVLRPGGRLLIYVPAFQVLYSSMDKKVGHLRRYRRREMYRKVEQAGFSSIKSRYADSCGFLASLLFVLSGNSSGDINPTMLKFYDRYVFPVSRVFDYFCGFLFGKNVVCIARKRK